MLCPPQKKGQNGALDPGVEAYETEGVALKQGGDKGKELLGSLARRNLPEL